MTKKISKKVRKPNPRRLELIELSDQMMALVELNDPRLLDVEGTLTPNNLIMQLVYPRGEYSTFTGWKEKGLKVIKGSKGFAIWGRKKEFSKKVIDDNGDEGESKYRSFPLAYIFHESQVEEMEVVNA